MSLHAGFFSLPACFSHQHYGTHVVGGAHQSTVDIIHDRASVPFTTRLHWDQWKQYSDDHFEGNSMKAILGWAFPWTEKIHLHHHWTSSTFVSVKYKGSLDPVGVRFCCSLYSRKAVSRAAFTRREIDIMGALKHPALSSFSPHMVYMPLFGPNHPFYSII